MDCEKIGLFIKTVRKEKGLTQKQLADKIGISDKTVSKWERGCGLPEVSLWKDLSTVLGVNIEDILKGNKHQLSYDIWEECEDIHTYSLATIFSAFESMIEIL